MKSLGRHVKNRTRRHVALAASIASVAMCGDISGNVIAQSPVATHGPALHQSPAQAVPQTGPGSRPRPAAVILDDGQLTVQANNSELSQILGEVARESGMVVEGNVGEARVYGTYGPADASAVLSELLEGMGYNVIIVGGAGGSSPKRLTLSSRIGSATPASPTVPANGSDTFRQNSPQNSQLRAEEPRLPPGAIAHPAPPPSDDPAVRRQQNMQNLQQRRAAMVNPLTPP